MSKSALTRKNLLNVPVTTSFVADKTLVEACRKLAFKRGISLSNWMRDAAVQKMSREKKKLATV